RKVGAFVNKPINQVTLTSLDIPFAMFAPKNLELEDADRMISGQSMAKGLDSLPEKLAVHEKDVWEFGAFVETLQ
ncbi:Autophagy-related protein 13, partial [Camelus dromedarius]